ncbi:MAG: hypothetical protein HQ553_16390 [Chloroflexi bacterium]|nr:hypothetical protein [Chloroflexota bacterium]
MPCLVIHAPSNKPGKTSFKKTVADQKGNRYAINSKIAPKAQPGCTVIVLDKPWKQRAEGILVELEFLTGDKAGAGIQRYNVHMKGLKQVPYKPERLNRNGVNFIEDCP